MNNRFPSSWSSQTLFPAPSSTGFTHLSGWWYRLTALPDPPMTVSFAEREVARKSRLVSSIVGFLLPIFLGFIPACLALSNRYVLLADTSMILICLLVLVLGKQGRVFPAGMLLTISFEAALTMVIITTQPFDEASLQQYELFVFGELFAVSLLPTGCVFAVAGYNSIVITWSLLFQFQTPHLQMMVQAQILPLWVRPVAVQGLVAAVTFLWVRSAMSANRRAEQAELVAQLEHYTSQQQRAQAEERKGLDEGLTDITNRFAHLTTSDASSFQWHLRPISSYHPQLHPLVRLFYLLSRRLRAMRQTESEWHRLKSAIHSRVEQLKHDQLEGIEQPSGTLLDTFVYQLARHGCLPSSRRTKRCPQSSEEQREEGH